MKLHEWQAQQRAAVAPEFVPDAERQCAGKERYFSRADAQQALVKMRASGKASGPLNTYLCCLCGDWHMGHPPNVGIPLVVAWVWKPWWVRLADWWYDRARENR